ncbi:hypothetical protein GLOIN_2v1779540 [Rhizophagus clarus]|uniref:Uncharacterized protein n=1 Tax=Rhizophagus clarus TaxID=94130 RepID=A0A8H3M0N3_9GLOM|nr:hypothetical protein GLOIN_2v1779540 [Rhizophagus clarus]
MSSKSRSRTCNTPYVQRINLNNNNGSKKRLPKLCHNCIETDDSIDLFSKKVNRIEEIVDNFKNRLKKKPIKHSIFNAKFTLNNVPCELEYDLSNFTLENLQKLVNFTSNNNISLK